jgi:hypothetical protein
MRFLLYLIQASRRLPHTRSYPLVLLRNNRVRCQQHVDSPMSGTRDLLPNPHILTLPHYPKHGPAWSKAMNPWVASRLFPKCLPQRRR